MGGRIKQIITNLNISTQVEVAIEKCPENKLPVESRKLEVIGSK